jgi:murein DD-endopeptidase MepM/ murein hydrolase activator NlpD
MKWLLVVLLVISAAPCTAASLEAVPRQVEDGGVVLLRLQSPESIFAVTRWNDAPVYLEVTPDGARGLLPVPLGKPAGSYPLTVAVVDRAGRTRRFQTEITVQKSNRPVERLTLPPAMVSPRKPELLKRIARDSKRLQAIYQQETPALYWDGFRRPVADPVGSLFGLQRILNGKPRSPHSGVDFRSPKGTPVYAPAAGRVVLVDDLYYTGKTVVVDHGGQLISIFAHLDQASVQDGELTTAGSLLGKVGSTGRSTGPHLHWTVRLAGERIDPLALLALLERERP